MHKTVQRHTIETVVQRVRAMRTPDDVRRLDAELARLIQADPANRKLESLRAVLRPYSNVPFQGNLKHLQQRLINALRIALPGDTTRHSERRLQLYARQAGSHADFMKAAKPHLETLRAYAQDILDFVGNRKRELEAPPQLGKALNRASGMAYTLWRMANNDQSIPPLAKNQLSVVSKEIHDMIRDIHSIIEAAKDSDALRSAARRLYTLTNAMLRARQG